ncbi:hypothetical protein KI387_012560, partial [Taxus chinensis]
DVVLVPEILFYENRARSQKLWPFEVSGPNVDFSSLPSAISGFSRPTRPFVPFGFGAEISHFGRTGRFAYSQPICPICFRTVWDKFAWFGRFAPFCPNCSRTKFSFWLIRPAYFWPARPKLFRAALTHFVGSAGSRLFVPLVPKATSQQLANFLSFGQFGFRVPH